MRLQGPFYNPTNRNSKNTLHRACRRPVGIATKPRGEAFQLPPSGANGRSSSM
ncbi:hypothetical protein BJX63DRAFT_411149 [Aspergillus granulosus]|uniref:Uncharacterized protein n=1 Tax=Aspergillus granulosus TaxID=176169 RepID=A0ABR4GZ27_9EURO